MCNCVLLFELLGKQSFGEKRVVCPFRKVETLTVDIILANSGTNSAQSRDTEEKSVLDH